MTFLTAAYVEADLAQFMLDELGPLAVDLGWTKQADVTAAVEDALYAYGVETAAEATDIPKLRALARVEAWQLAVNATASDINSSTDGQSLSMAQRHAQAIGRLTDARYRAQRFTSAGAVTITRTRYRDPLSRHHHTSGEFGNG